MNDDIAVLPSKAGRVSPTDDADIGPFTNPFSIGLSLDIDITTNAGGLGSLTVTLLRYDPVSGKKITLLASAALTAVATTQLKVGVGLVAAANLVANDLVPKLFYVRVAHNANPITYTIGMHLHG